ncbi:MAG: hypothetical protein EZS28_035521 [Streblomastix strix]|uniref:Uncharacterized protein n=1 Tax=Streblomastix strix TaxID=222440 RepID=A0A5J4UFE3_9EUKA|nr:MAG: hypothetical protein EZS28_035521 [Streblomastix strix]
MQLYQAAGQGGCNIPNGWKGWNSCMIEDRRQKKVRLERYIVSFEMELDELKEELKRLQIRMESVKNDICKVNKNDDRV